MAALHMLVVMVMLVVSVGMVGRQMVMLVGRQGSFLVSLRTHLNFWLGLLFFFNLQQTSNDGPDQEVIDIHKYLYGKRASPTLLPCTRSKSHIIGDRQQHIINIISNIILIIMFSLFQPFTASCHV